MKTRVKATAHFLTEGKGERDTDFWKNFYTTDHTQNL